MKSKLATVIAFLFYFTCLAQSNLTTFPVNASWQFRQADAAEWLPAKVPGCVHTDLIYNKVIEHPFFGENEKACQWVGEKDWIYETIPFAVEDSILNRSVVRLKFNGLDTYTEVYLNDKLVLKSDNAYRSWEVDVTKLLKNSGNVLRINFFSPIPIAEKRLVDLSYPLPGDGVRAMVRKPQFHFGWDFGPKLLLCGITKPVEIIAYDLARFTDIHIEQLKITDALAELKTTFTIHSDKDQDANIIFEMTKSGDNWMSDVQLKKGMNIVELPFEIPFPYRWWCNDEGAQNLYENSVLLRVDEKIIDSSIKRTGLRNIKLMTQKDSIGESFFFELNEKPIFIKGANYIPIKYFPGEVTTSDYRKLLKSCKDAHINMLRVWGGGVYEDEKFYEICDEMGIMVWQDFMFACSMYPADSIFVSGLIEEANEQTKRLRNHPCIALWCGNNEVMEGWENWGWQTGLTDRQKFMISRAYNDVFDLTLKKIVVKNTHTDFWESSPRYGRANPASLVEGDSHYWGLWHDEEPFEILKEKIPRFMSEFGMQSFPSDDVLKEMMVKDEFSYNDPGLDAHQKHNRGFKLLDKYMNAWYPKISHDNLSMYGRMTQVVQAEGMTMGIEAQRRAMPRCMGTMYWQLNDVWPAFSWSGMDYKGNPKLLHDYLQTVYAPQLISSVVTKDELFIYWISDNEIPEDNAELHFRIYDGNNIPVANEVKKDIVPIYISDKRLVMLKNGSSVILRMPLTDVIGKETSENKLIDVTLTRPGATAPEFHRIQKLIPNSDQMIIPTSYSFPTYEGKSKKRKENIGIRFEKGSN